MKPFMSFLISTFLSVSVFAEQKVEFDGYEMHYIVLNTTEIPAEIAEFYALKRSGKRAFINLSILKQTPDGYGTPVTTDVTAIQRSLVGQKIDIALREIREGEAIYYIGDFPIINREVLWFDIDLILEDDTRFSFSFDQQVWQE